MHRHLRRLVLVALFTALAIPVLWLSLLPAALRAGLLNRTIEARLAAAVGFPVRIGSLDMPSARQVIAREITLSPGVPGLAPVTVSRAVIRLDGVASVRDVTVDGVRATVEISADRLRELARAREGPPSETRPLRLAGPLDLPPLRVRDIQIDGRCGEDVLALRDGEIRIDPATPFVIPFAVTGRLITSPDPDIDVRGTLELTASSGRVRLDRFKLATLSANVGLDVPRPDAAAASLSVDGFKLPRALMSVLEGLTGMKAHGQLTTSWTVNVENGALARLEMQGELVNYELEREGITVKHRKGRTRLTAAVTPHPDGGWRATGGVVDLEIELGRGSVLHFPQATFEAHLNGGRTAGVLRFDDAFAASADVESSKVAGELAFDMRRDSDVLDGSVTLTLRKAEVLKGDVYAEIDPTSTVEVKLAGRFDLGRAAYEFKGTALSMAGLGRVALDGRVSRTPEGLSYDVAVETGDVDAAVLGKRLGEALTIENLSLGGTFRVKARVTGVATDYTVDGRAFLGGVTARLGDVSVSKLRGDVPVLLGALEREERGAIEFDDFVPLPGVALGPRRIELVARANELRARGEIAFDLWGGRAFVSEIAAWDLRGVPHFDADVAVEDADLARVGEAFKLKRKLEGKLSLSPGKVLVTRPQITLTGDARARIFEGEVRAQHIRVLWPLDPVQRAVRCSFAMEGIRLRRVCETLTEFGLIDGVAEANGQLELHGGGLPNWMQITLRTVPKPGTEQICDVKAVKALATIIGGPEMASALSMSPTDKLYYDKFGFYAALDVDFTFYPRGLWFKRGRDGAFVENDIEDLKKGRRPAERGLEFMMIGKGMHQININIVNPGGGIDFNDIIERFKLVSEKK